MKFTCRKWNLLFLPICISAACVCYNYSAESRPIAELLNHSVVQMTFHLSPAQMSADKSIIHRYFLVHTIHHSLFFFVITFHKPI